jgi:hypothetical protein
MAHAKGLLRGPKFNGRHSTVIPSAIPAVEAARDSTHVTKIALGVIKPIKPGTEHLKFTPVSYRWPSATWRSITSWPAGSAGS